MLGSIKYNLSHLLDFSGRDARQTFWYYVLFLSIVYMALSMIGAFVLMGSLIGPIVETANSGASEQQMQAHMAQEMGSIMSRMMTIVLYGSMVANAIFDALLAASFVRRLHDSDSSGWWGLVVVAAQLAGMALMIPMMDTMQQFMAQGMNPEAMQNPAYMNAMMAQQSKFGLYGLLGWVGPITVIVFGVMASTEGPNRFGEAPVRF